MIKLESIHIEEVRGIRRLDLDFRTEKFAISGPNGSGKSGTIDAIEFGLTGQMRRLAGRGTKGLSVAQHGPHVDKVKFPDAAFVTLKVFLTDLHKSVTITRFISAPRKPTLTPDDSDVRTALAEVAAHPEITLSRREILRFILVEPAKRSEEIQALLKLEEIGETRKVLNAALNKLDQMHKDAAALASNGIRALRLHLQTEDIQPEAVLEVVNRRRVTLGLPALLELTKDTNFDAGLVASAILVDFNKEAGLREIATLVTASAGTGDLAKSEAGLIVEDLLRLQENPALVEALQKRAFVEQGLSLIDGPECPLCDTAWPDIDHLKNHLKGKLANSEEARKLQESVLENCQFIGARLLEFIGLLNPVEKIAEAMGNKEFASILRAFKSDLEMFKTNLGSIDEIRKLKSRFETGWISKPTGFTDGLPALTEQLKAKPDQSATIDAQTFLTTAQVRLTDFRQARKGRDRAALGKASAKLAYDTYCTVFEDELNALYEQVQQDFSRFYRALNGNDELTFTAKMVPSASSVTLDVNFYERGLFPPAAYHSEGHQDGMGVCLYLALMKRLFGAKFTLSLLDDVVMSVDRDHRYEFCKLLKTTFPDTQFIITTHDRVWAQQMKSAGLITGKTSIVFYSWNIDTGPVIESNEGIWNEISTVIDKGRVDTAAFMLRRHLEYSFSVLADELGARPQFRADGNYEFDDMLTSVLKRSKELWGKAEKSAASWAREEERKVAAQKKQFLSTCDASARVDQWMINKSVHYNAWADLGKSDFQHVVAAFKDLLECFHCKKCDGWIYALPKGSAEALRCPCTEINFNLMEK